MKVWTYSKLLNARELVYGMGSCWIVSTESKDQTAIPAELDALLQQVRLALNLEQYYLALAVTMSIPDICSCLEQEPGKIYAKTEKYIAWCERNLSGKISNLVAGDYFHIRGGLLHQGHFKHPKSKFDRIVFFGQRSAIVGHGVIINFDGEVTFGGASVEELGLRGENNRVLLLDIIKFCNTIVDAAREWAITKDGDAFVSENVRHLARFRPNGLPPFIVGCPVIA